MITVYSLKRCFVVSVFFTVLMLCSVPCAVADVDVEDQNSAQVLSEFELGKYQYCGQDSDCMKAINGCCDCANGGQDAAVNKAQYQDFLTRFRCVDVMCTQLARTPPCGSGVVSCVNHKCRYMEAKE